MRIHSLNCGSMTMPGDARLVCHVLLLETEAGLVLVDTGFGLADIADPRHRIGPYRAVIRPKLDPAETAARQVEALGFRRADVTHIVITHFDIDHIGGLADFPDALVHVTAAEAEGAVHHPSWRERIRFNPRQWAHGPRLVEHEVTGDEWFGFAAAEQLTGIDPRLVYVALPGHTRGHAAVAIETGERWLLHAGDAFYHHSAIDGVGRQQRSVTIQERLVAYDNRLARANRARLAQLHRERAADVDIISAHDPELFARHAQRHT